MIKKLSLLTGILLLLIPSTVLAQISITPSTLVDRQFDFEVTQGNEVKGAFLITNLSKTRTAIVELYGADATQNQLGTLEFSQKTDQQKTVGAWTQVEIGHVTLEPRETKNVTFKLALPENASPGLYMGGLIAEEITGETNNSQVNISARVVTKIQVKVPGEVTHKYELLNFKENNQKNGFIIELKNTGNSLVTHQSGVEIGAGFPNSAHTILEMPEGKIFQGETAKIEIPWKEKPIWGFLTAKAHIVTGQYDFLLRESINQQVLTQEVQIIIIPWIIIIPTLGLTIFLVGYWIYSKRKIKKLRGTFVKYKVKEGENIMKIAETHKIKWKLLAKINTLKAPYNLSAGQEILVPPNKNAQSIKEV